MGSERGQATIDYVALIAVVAIVLGLAVVAAPLGAPGIVNAVTGQIRHALCVVGGGPCPDARAKPCVVASRRDLHHFAVSLLIVRLDHDRYVLREAMSDGTVRLTVARSGAAGLEGGVGAVARVLVQGRKVGTADELRAAAQLTLGRGTVYVARDEHEATAFMAAIRDGRAPGPAREVFYDGGVRALAQAGIGSGWLEGMAANTLGARRDRRTGELTVGLSTGGAGWGGLTSALVGPAAAAESATGLALTLDRRRRPIELSLTATGMISGGVLPLALQRGLGRTYAAEATTKMTGRRWELGVRLDLRDPQVRANWARFRAHPTSAGAIRALAETVRDRAYLDARAYGIDTSADGVAAGIAGGVRIGGEYDHVVDRARLLGASSRPPAGLWERRVDCVAA
jgi:hypothetical protein